MLLLLVPYYSTTGFLQGSSKAGYLGEASIDFADFAAETEPLTVSLPLKFANSGAVLHVSTVLLNCNTRNLMRFNNCYPTLSVGQERWQIDFFDILFEL